jgi:hypothetical protein
MASEREIAITEAITAIQDGQVSSVKASAAKFGIPRSTLRGRLNGATDRSTAQQTTQRLTAEQERGLIDWIKGLEAQGNPPSHTVIREMVSKIETTSNPTSNPTPIGNHWVDRFIRRHPEISCIGVPLESSRAQVQGLKKGQRKRATIDPNQTFADIDSTRNAQKPAEAAREVKTKSDEELRLASEQASSLGMEDMMFEFQS